MANLEQNGKLSIIEKIQQTPAPDIVKIPEVADRFKQLYSIIHPGQKAEAFLEAEKFHFGKLLTEKPDLAGCTKLSLFGCFMDVAVSGLSFDPSFKHLYLVAYNVNAGTRDNPKWEKRAQLQISGQGELILRIKQGQIRHVDNPVLVYEGDEFSFGHSGGKMVVNHLANISKRTNNIIAGYLKITRNDGSLDYKVMTRDEIDSLRKFSKDPDSKAWTDGFAGMFTAKLIKHAFKNYPKLRVGDNTTLTSETVDQELTETEIATMGTSSMNVPAAINYGDDIPQVAPTAAPQQTVTVQDDEF